MSLTSPIPIFNFISLMIICAMASDLPMSRQDCPEKCGNINIPYPFGTKEGCYRTGFGLTCNVTSSELFLGSNLDSTNIKISNINLSFGEVTAFNSFVYRCFDKSGINFEGEKVSLRLNPAYLFSAKRNKFTVIGCYALAFIEDEEITHYASGCLSYCNKLDKTTNGSCNGVGCCQTPIPEGLSFYNVTWGFKSNNASSFSPCIYAALLEEAWYNFNVADLNGKNFRDRTINGMPVVMDWAIRDGGTCKNDTGVVLGDSACLSKNSSCSSTSNGKGYLCQCLKGYEGNPYIEDGCHDINECENKDIYPCYGICTNTDGDYQCKCRRGRRGDGKIAGNCTEIFPYQARVSIVSILIVAMLVAIGFLIDAYRQKKRYNKEKREHLKYYEMMKTAVSVYTEEEIKVATNNFDENQVLGTGGHGKVYRGLLDNKQVAIKKSKEVELTEREEFVNEIILLSQLNNTNIVRILGCCLEVKIPMLVFEFVPNGSLFDLLHRKMNNRWISLATRIKIALGSAKALDYLHNCICRSIIHGDVKSANILLDDKNIAKVSDFGASNLVPTDEVEVIQLVHVTRGYLDPECWSTQVITKKSDVYSFGVVLLELITRKKAIYRDETNELKNLATSFVSMVNKNKMNEMLDKEILDGDEKVIEILSQVSELALWCLSVKGDDRPEMTQVVQKLQSMVTSNQDLFEQNDADETESMPDESSLYTKTFMFHSTESSSVLEIQDGTPR